MWQNPKEQPEKKSKEKEMRETAHVRSCWVNMAALASCIASKQATAKQGAARGSAGRGACYQPYQPDSDPHCPPADRRELTPDLHTLWCPRMHVCTGVNMHANKQTNGEERERLGEACHSLGWWHSPLIPPFMGDQQFGAFLSSAVTTRPGWVTWNPASKQHFKKKIYHKGDH